MNQETAKARIDRAAEVTNQVDAAWALARTSINGVTQVNGYGIYRDPQQVRSLLADARYQLDLALALLAEAEWPKDEDYDTL